MPFDANGNWTPTPSAYPSIPGIPGFSANQGAAASLGSTPYLDSMDRSSFMNSWNTPSVEAPALMGQMPVDTTGFSNLINPSTPGFGGWLSDTMGGIGRSLKDSGFLGGIDKQTGQHFDGWGNAAISAGSGLMTGFLGMKQYGLFKDQLAQSKRQFDLNYEAQKKTINSHMEDRQRARLANNPNAVSVEDYMKKYGI